MTPEQLIADLGMQELPVEGGYFAQTHRSDEVSAIAYLLRKPDFSCMHVLKHLEIYNFHAGSPLWNVMLLTQLLLPFVPTTASLTLPGLFGQWRHMLSTWTSFG